MKKLKIEKTRTSYPGTAEWVEEQIKSFEPVVCTFGSGDDQICVKIDSRPIIFIGTKNTKGFCVNNELKTHRVYAQADEFRAGLFDVQLSKKAHKIAEDYLNSLEAELVSWFEE